MMIFFVQQKPILEAQRLDDTHIFQDLYQFFLILIFLQMEDDPKIIRNFQRASEVLRTRLNSTKNRMDIIKEEDEEHPSKKQKQDGSEDFYEDSDSEDYLFGNDMPSEKKHKKKLKPRQEQSERQSEVLDIEPPQQFVPLKRQTSRALSQSFGEIKKPNKTKPRYKKQDNVGNQMIEVKKIDTIFKFICDPDRNITVNSLGHALQKFKVNFELKDIVDMLKLYSSIKNPNHQESQPEEGVQNMDLQVKLREEEFRELYQMIRKKPKK